MEKSSLLLKTSLVQQLKAAPDPITGEQESAGGNWAASKIEVQHFEVWFWGDPAAQQDAATTPGVFRQGRSSSNWLQDIRDHCYTSSAEQLLWELLTLHRISWKSGHRNYPDAHLWHWLLHHGGGSSGVTWWWGTPGALTWVSERAEPINSAVGLILKTKYCI